MILKHAFTTLLLGLMVLCSCVGLAWEEQEKKYLVDNNPETGLVSLEGCLFVPTPWADGDSFLVRVPDGTEHTIRIYGADCIEWHVTDETDARRLRTQRRYFGISREDSNESIKLAKQYGAKAYTFVKEQLKEPFTVHTAFANARGDDRYHRVYGFITTSKGDDLSTLLVHHGLARAHGVSRMTPDGTHRDHYRSALQDDELVAASRGRGVWAHTDWERLPAERRDERIEVDMMARSMGRQSPPEKPLDLNCAAMDELMRIPGIGEVFANRIVENRPYHTVDDVARVHGIGPVMLERIRPYLSVTTKQKNEYGGTITVNDLALKSKAVLINICE